MRYFLYIRVCFSDAFFRDGTGLLAGFAGDCAMEYRFSPGQGIAGESVAGRVGVLALVVHVFVYGAFRSDGPEDTLVTGMR